MEEEIKNFFENRGFTVKLGSKSILDAYIGFNFRVYDSITNKRCLLFRLVYMPEGPYLDLFGLNKCSDRPSTIFLDLVKELAAKLHLRKIDLLDLSEITIRENISISLANYKLLTAGQSWYNQHGFVSSDIEEERKHNSLIGNMTIHEFFKAYKQKIPSADIDKLILHFKTVSPLVDVERVTVRQWLLSLNYNLKYNENLTDEDLVYIAKFVKEYAGVMLKYTTELTYWVV